MSGILEVPPRASGVVVFAYGSRSGQFSPRDRVVARELFRAGLATVVLDLLTAEEDAEDTRTGQLDLEVGVPGQRVIAAIDRLACDASAGDLPPALAELPVGCFGAGTGAAAAVIAAAQRPHRVRAVVSRAGRLDLAADALSRVTAPTLLIVGDHDAEALRPNRMAADRVAGPSRLEIVPGAGHLFEEPVALEAVARLARDWFLEHLTEAANGPRRPAG